MHAHQLSLNQCRSRALSASPSPPPIPPQPNYIQYKQKLPSFEAPPPPPRCYQVVPIRDTTNQNTAPSPKLQSFGNSSFGRNSLNSRNNYENIRDIIKPPFIVKDPRRKPYYYNELNQSVDVELGNQDTQLDAINESQSTEIISNDEIIRNSAISDKSTTRFGSGGSLDHIF